MGDAAASGPVGDAARRVRPRGAWRSVHTTITTSSNDQAIAVRENARSIDRLGAWGSVHQVEGEEAVDGDPGERVA